MSLHLSDLAPCFEGVIPSIIATAAADGMPNISYLSHVVRVDDDHVALSNQFFAKTAANIRANPHVALIIVDGFTGVQYLLDIRFVRSIDTGPLFDRISLQLKASSALVGMSDVMRLRSADIFRVLGIEAVRSPVETAAAPRPRAAVNLPALADAGRAIENQTDVESIIDDLLHGVSSVLGYQHALVLIPDTCRGCLITTGSIGYGQSGLGSEISVTDGLIGAAATSGNTIKVSDMSRVRRYGEAVVADAEMSEDTAHAVTFPQLPSAMSQIAVPMKVRGETVGIIFVESPERMAFRDEDEAALEILARQAAQALKTSERAEEAAEFTFAPPPPAKLAEGPEIRVVYHSIDDSIFIDGTYVVKGIAGALLRLMLACHRDEGRTEFSNRELRLALAARMPDIKDNLETRLLLLRRRLEEKRAPIQVVRTGRGRLCVEAQGQPLLIAAE